MAQLLALGVDPSRSTIYVQSHIPEIAQLTWVLSCLTGFGEANRMTQFRTSRPRQGTESAGVGLFTYPILMAADILAFQVDEVPVGEDQRQHLELTRDLASRFNARYGQTFTVPRPHRQGVRQDLRPAEPDGQDEQVRRFRRWADQPARRSEAFGEEDQIRGHRQRLSRRLRPRRQAGVSNLLTIQSALTGRSIDELVTSYEGKQYGHLKVDTADVLTDFVTPLRGKVDELLADPAHLDGILADGAAKARAVASPTLRDVYDKVGFLAPSAS